MELPSPELPPISVSGFSAVLLFCGALLTAVLALFGVRYTARAPLQVTLNDAFRTLMNEWQSEKSRLLARISELEAEVRRQRGEINQHIQVTQSLEHRIQRMLEDRE